MRGHFDNSVQWLADMPPSVLSTEGSAAKMAEGLQKRTGLLWNVKLVSPDHRNGGGFFVSPPDKRLVEGVMSPKDWQHLRRLFGAVPASMCRWYLFPDEIAAAFDELGIPIYSGWVANVPPKKDGSGA